jgi:hypothetical protein
MRIGGFLRDRQLGPRVDAAKSVGGLGRRLCSESSSWCLAAKPG